MLEEGIKKKKPPPFIRDSFPHEVPDMRRQESAPQLNIPQPAPKFKIKNVKVKYGKSRQKRFTNSVQSEAVKLLEALACLKQSHTTKRHNRIRDIKSSKIGGTWQEQMLRYS